MGETKLAQNLEEGDVINAKGVAVEKVLPVFGSNIVQIYLSNGEMWRKKRDEKIAVFTPTPKRNRRKGRMHLFNRKNRRVLALLLIASVLVAIKASQNESFPFVPSKDWS